MIGLDFCVPTLFAVGIFSAYLVIDKGAEIGYDGDTGS